MGLVSVFLLKERRKGKQDDLDSSQSRGQSLLAAWRGKRGPGDVSGCRYGGLVSLLSSRGYSFGHDRCDSALSTDVGSPSCFGLAFLGNPWPEGVTESQVHLPQGRKEKERERKCRRVSWF